MQLQNQQKTCTQLHRLHYSQIIVSMEVEDTNIFKTNNTLLHPPVSTMIGFLMAVWQRAVSQSMLSE